MDPMVPITPAKTEQPQRNRGQPAMTSPGESIHSSGACYAYDPTRRNFGLLSFGSQVQNSMAGMGQTLPYPQLFQATPAQAGGNLTHPYWPAMGSYLAGYPGLLNPPPFLHTEMQMHGDIPGVASKQGPKTISQDQDYYICERNGSVSWTCMTPQNASFYDQCSPNVAKHSSISHNPSFSTSPTSIQPVTPAKESPNRERKGGSQGIDLNKTPRQTQKRKKHRPKVVNEGKPRKTQQPVTPERQKRKYVRKSVSKGQSTSPYNCEKSSKQISPTEGAKPSCKRALDFDSPVSRGQGVAESAGSWIVSGMDSQSYSQQVPQKKSGGTTLPSTENGLDSSLGILQDRSIHILSSDHRHAEKELERKFYKTIIAEKIKQTATVDTNEHGHICSKKSKTIDMQKDSTPAKIRSTIASAGNNRYSYQFQFRTTETQHEYPNGNICEFQLGNHYYSSNSEQKCLPPKVGQSGISFVKLLEGKPSSDEVGNLQSILNTTKKKTRRPRKLSTDACDQQFLTVVKKKQPHISRRYEVESETTRHHLEGRSRMQDSTSHYAHSMLHTRTADGVVSVDEVIEMMKCLNINGDSKPDASPQNALVVYSGNRQMVLYGGSVDPNIKKQRPRAKVDLDGETLRVWNMLMGKQGSDNTHNADTEKEEYWREERQVFKERVDSFIARMHLVQGNRRFSRWKGSVVDSVVGVFLTQNVSDHLSSSAFMALAAKFPLDTRIRRNNDMHHGEETSMSTCSKCQGSPSNQRITNEHSERTLEVNLMEGGEIRSDSNHPSRCLYDTLECDITATNSAVSTLDSTHSRDETISQISSEVEVEEVENVVMGSKCSDKFSGATSFIELLQMQDEESRNCYHNWHENVLFQEWYPHVFTNQKRESTVQKDAANTEDIFTGNMTGLLQSQLASIYENKNQMSQAEDITDTSQVEEVICSQNSLVSSLSYTDSCIQIVNDIGLNNLELQEREKVVTGFEWCPALDGKTSYTELLQMQGSQTLQELYSNNRSSVDSSSQVNEKMIHEHWKDNSLEHTKELCPFVCCGKEARRPYCQSFEMGSTGVFQDDIRPCLPAHSSKTTYIEDACCTGRGHETEFPSSCRIISASNSMSPISSMSNSFVQGGEHLIHTSFAAEPRTAAKLEEKKESGLDVNIIEEPLEIQERSETTFKVNVAASESRAQASTERCEYERQSGLINRNGEAVVTEMHSSGRSSVEAITNNTKPKIKKSKKEREKDTDWSKLRKDACMQGPEKARSCETMDSLDYEAIRCTSVSEISDAIRERGMNNMLAERIKGFLNRVFHEQGNIDLEWLRDVSPDQGKDYLLSILGLGLKSVECVRLLSLHQHAFPVDTNVARIAVRLGWVPIQPLPESSQIHLLELYPMLDHVQKYLWPRLCELDQKTLYELHYQMITFGKVFCTKSRPNCNACPMKAECKHFASAFASAKLALPAPQNKSSEPASLQLTTYRQENLPVLMPLPSPVGLDRAPESGTKPIIEEPASPKSEDLGNSQKEIEDAWWEEDPDEIPTIKLNTEQFSQSIQTYMQENNMKFEDVLMSKALVTLSAQAASIPIPKLKNISRLRTEHLVYELPDCHALLSGLDPREADDPCPYLLAVWSPGETANSVELPEIICHSQESGALCDNSTCSACNSRREANTHTVRGTLLIPCRTATRGSFPLNGTYFQVNEVFADHDSSLEPINVPRAWIWNLPRRTVYFGTSVTTIFRGLTVESIQQCFWRGFVCVRGIDRMTRAPRPLMARLHLSASRVAKQNKQGKKTSA